MKFKEYLIEFKIAKKQSKGLYKEEFFKMANNSMYKKTIELYRETDHMLFRGVPSANSMEYGFYPKRTEDRMSQNTGNEYTVMINNDPTWKGYPKRQTIVSTSAPVASGYGKLFVVIPPYGTMLGICSQADIWHSFEYFENETDVKASLLNDIFYYPLYHFITNPAGGFETDEERDFVLNNKNVDTYVVFKRLCDLYDDYKERLIEYNKEHDYILLNKWKNIKIPMFKYLQQLLEPNENEFQKTRLQTGWDDTEIFVKRGREVWFDAECLIIPKMMFPQMAEELLQ
jgi:hypothetical protein